MAEEVRNRLPSGYDDDFVGTFEDDFQCLICYLPLKEPVLTRCGHRYCKECLEEYFRRQEIEDQPLTCPADREGLDRDREVFLDKATERKILSLAIKCPSEGCAWTGELRSKETHLASCPLRDVSCTNDNCQVTLKRKDLSEHVSVTCQWRIVLCEHCNEPHPKCQMEDHIREKCKLRPFPCPYECGALNLREKDLQDHLETCECLPVMCPNKCKTIMSREMVSNHIEDYCPLTKIPCSYAWMGCRAEVQRNQLESHIECGTRSHLDLTRDELRKPQEKLTEKTTQFDRLQKRVNILVKQFEEKVNNIQHQHQNNIDSLQQQHQEQLEEKVKTCQVQHQRKVDILQEQIEQKIKTSQTDIEDKVLMKFAIILVILGLGAEFAIFCMSKSGDTVSYSNKLSILDVNTEESRIFMWKITGFENQVKNNETKVIASVPFYAYGYKLYLKLFPNGNGVGKNTHLSIYISVVTGEFDAILPWGFSIPVTFTLIDQQDNQGQRQDVVHPTNIPLKKPVDGQTRPGWGFPQFISHRDLRTRRFIVDDTLFIKVQVDSPKDKKS